MAPVNRYYLLMLYLVISFPNFEKYLSYIVDILLHTVFRQEQLNEQIHCLKHSFRAVQNRNIFNRL